MSETDGLSHIRSGRLISDKVCCQREVAFDWQIKTSLPNESGDTCYSPDFHFCGRTWHLMLSGIGETIYQTQGHVELFLCCWGSDLPFEVQFSLGIRTAKGGPKVEVTGVAIFDQAHARFCVSRKMITGSELSRRRDEMLPLDILTIRATLKAEHLTEGTKDMSVQTEDFAAEYENDENFDKTGTERVLQDIGNMWPGGDHCDVVLRLGDAEFKAHSAILAARTPVLGAMFRHDTAEKATGEVTIEDCEPAAFEQLLHYVYKGAPRELTAENACALYVVADKYLVSELKALCVRCMRDTLCADTFCATVTVCLRHGEDDLLRAAVDFFSRNMLRVAETVQWQIFLRDHSTWANEILIRALKNRSQK